MTERVVPIRIELQYTKPRVWRRVEVPLSFTLWEMNAVVQTVFDWEGWDHLWAFQLMRRDLSRYGMSPHLGWGPESADEMQIKTLLDWDIKKLLYIYDFGDSWEHLLTIMRILDADPRIKYPRLVAGANPAPIEDLGGISGYYRLLEVARDPNHPEREYYEDRYSKSFLNDLVNEHFDKERTDSRLKSLR